MKLPGALLALILVMQLTGCGSSAIGPEEGRISFGDGSPVTSGSVEFRNRSTRERFTSRIESDGSFAPISGEGILGLPRRLRNCCRTNRSHGRSRERGSCTR